MIEGLKPYSDYKDSGLSWARELPRHWHLRRLKTVFREVDQRSKTGRETLLSLRAKSGLVDHHGLGGRVIPPESLINYKRVKPGQIVMNRMRASAGLFAIPPQEGLVSPDYSVLSPQAECSLRYFVELFKTPQMGAIFRAESHGLGTGESGFLRLYFNSFGPITAPFPPKEEQEAIVRFLAHANQKIDGFIRAKRKLIGLLNEQKQAIIHQAVTRGIDPSVPLKPSGIPWLGDIPKHWEVRRLKGVLRGRLTNGLFKRGDDFGSGTLLVNVADVYAQEGIILPDKLERVRCSPEEKATFRVLPGDMFFVRSSLKLEGTGRCALVQDLAEDAVFECHIVRGRPDGRVVDADFLLMFLRSWVGTSNVVARAKTVTMSTVGQTEISSLPVAVPPLHEQRELLKIVATESAPATAAITRTEREIALMQEYRTRLTADLVTGKLDVREAASKLPEVSDLASEETAEEVDENELDSDSEPE